MRNINDNAIQGHLSENYLTRKIIAWSILDTKYSLFQSEIWMLRFPPALPIAGLQPIVASSYLFLTCWQSSLVGAQMSPMGPSSSFSSGWSMAWTKRGQRKAAVFPEPVLAIPMMSRPLRATGMACDWMAVGWENSDFRINDISSSSKPKWAKDTHGFGGEYPDTCKKSAHNKY